MDLVRVRGVVSAEALVSAPLRRWPSDFSTAAASGTAVGRKLIRVGELRSYVGHNGNELHNMVTKDRHQQCRQSNRTTRSRVFGQRNSEDGAIGFRERNSVSQRELPPFSVSEVSSVEDFSRRDFVRKNPLIEQLQRTQDELEEIDDDVDDFNDIVEEKPRNALCDVPRVHPMAPNEKSAMSRIVEKLSSIPSTRRIYESKNRGPVKPNSGSDSVFRPKYGQPMFTFTEREWTTPDNPVPNAGAPRSGKAVISEILPTETIFPWEKEDCGGDDRSSGHLTGVSPPSLAELTIPDVELERMRSLGVRMRRHVKIGPLGVTRRVVEAVHKAWRDSEVVKIRCEGPVARTMRKIYEALEEKTGGLVVWKAGFACLVYRGKEYVPPVSSPLSGLPEESFIEAEERREECEVGTATAEGETNGKAISSEDDQSVFVPRVSDVYDLELEQELEDVLSTLGPRYNDWTGSKPIPVDADLIIGKDVEFRKPFRQLPYGVTSGLTNLEMTNLKRLSKAIPPHFVLGVNRGLGGLAAAIVKLWERSEIAKIAVKRGIQNANHELMSRELKRLTGGILLARDKYFILFYRGKDFLPQSIASALEAGKVQEAVGQSEGAEKHVEAGEYPVLEGLNVSKGRREEICTETLDQEMPAKDITQVEFSRKVAKQFPSQREWQIERKVSIMLAKKQRAEFELQKVEERLAPLGPPPDREHITEEERNMFSKLGKKMRAFLLLGRRGVFGGTIENMHLHWKHRELVKIIYKARDRIDLEQTARMLEYESGGILVATLATSKGQAVILYRGKNYQRPPLLRPPNLLSKRDALHRSIEMQRRESLAKHLLSFEKDLSFLEQDLRNARARRVEHPNGSNDATTEPMRALETNRDDFRAPMDTATGGAGEVLHKPATFRATPEVSHEDAIFRASPISRREKLILRQQALKEKNRVTHYNVGHSNVVAGLAKAIRRHFKRRALVKVGIKGRAKGTPVEEILFQLEEATGGTLVSQEHSKIILYRGWPEGQAKPTEESGRWEKIPDRLREAIRAEGEPDDANYLHESDLEESGDDEERVMLTGDAHKSDGSMDAEATSRDNSSSGPLMN